MLVTLVVLWVHKQYIKIVHCISLSVRFQIEILQNIALAGIQSLVPKWRQLF